MRPGVRPPRLCAGGARRRARGGGNAGGRSRLPGEHPALLRRERVDLHAGPGGSAAADLGPQVRHGRGGQPAGEPRGESERHKPTIVCHFYFQK